MLAVAKHQRYVSDYSGLLLPIYYNWEVAMGESYTSSLHLWFTCIYRRYKSGFKIFKKYKFPGTKFLGQAVTGKWGKKLI